jgi:hypothetical protein
VQATTNEQYAAMAAELILSRSGRAPIRDAGGVGGEEGRVIEEPSVKSD